ncbi:hypothetical protein [Chryseolinea sp. H1M3-3]|uniref:hypothetical protein n=1 Tax=Chryseolinea sp. H1M3-3 TaxID=3034144 RepID=UPI0023EB1F0A|nr:hypothetical protein [Chryseolinea sp. H1M3-3]
MKALIIILLSTFSLNHLFGQQSPSSQSMEIEQLKKDVLALNKDVNNIQMNLGKAENKFKRGIGMATLGYSVTIAGGLMLGRKNDDLGKILLVSGGAIGITGTILMVDAFKYLGRAAKKRP